MFPTSRTGFPARRRTGEEQAFGQKLADQAPSTAADAHANRHFARARRRSRQQQVGDVHARDQEDDADHRHQDDERARVLAAERGRAAQRRNQPGGRVIVRPIVAGPDVFRFRHELLEHPIAAASACVAVTAGASLPIKAMPVQLSFAIRNARLLLHPQRQRQRDVDRGARHQSGETRRRHADDRHGAAFDGDASGQAPRDRGRTAASNSRR